MSARLCKFLPDMHRGTVCTCSTAIILFTRFVPLQTMEGESILTQVKDHEMMAAFNVSYLEDLNYPETTRFIDPMEPRYRAVPFVEEDYRLRTGPFTNASITDKCTFFESLKGYSGAAGAEEALVAYWNTHTTSTTALATTALATTALATTALATTALTTTTPTTFRTSTTSTKSTSKRAS